MKKILFIVFTAICLMTITSLNALECTLCKTIYSQIKDAKVSQEEIHQKVCTKMQNGKFNEVLQFLKLNLNPNDYALIETEIKNMQPKMAEIIKQDSQNATANIETVINKTIEKTKSTSIYSVKLFAEIIAGIFVTGIAIYCIGMGIEKGVEIYEKSDFSFQENIKIPLINTLKEILIKSKVVKKPSYRDASTKPTYGISR
ncbi:TPA: hypothetical protein DEO28_03925 [Candidatus Dependentiae bacterium]|nr:MAG: hypothetical protein UR14_C0006G0022 [candidate division TM6 bacterium GW2011_GWE2_31_21]KKP53555.1 MAG: hypothetical protein UR43_C0004G0096 [candidate division TM6 bacterium GW2011_GWF2_33_332]HBS48204.1 hypothetical protein [Candidatus Dependentiae bacterium]HBZ73630.1 hypothetical protein [Candidatus Dependentiae bacterium]